MAQEELLMLRALVRGRVQGVGFRAFAVDSGAKLALTGFARNTRDGHVEVVAEGLQSSLDALLALLRRGPSMSRVEHVDVSWGVATGDYAGFTVRH